MVHVRHRRTAAWAAAAVLILVPAAGCSDDGGGGSTPSPTPSATAPTTPATSAPAADGPADPAAAKQQIEENWTTFFDPEASTEDKVKVLENGNLLRPLLAAFGGDENAAQSSAKVTDVQFTSPTEATVTYDLLVGGTPALPGSKGTSVLQDDTWKVSVKTLCALVKLSGNAAAPGC
ncbi:hypothetical protein HRW23_31985 [Streptomyces lunaelactis]|nr:hypothetical protein [Streptomyces lunaelactis]NUK02358.1 hypothetical protein [Streptomyces lunaelactis]NUK09149.1 hypothetical protein [Streptomyces lunaelactis]NUK16155.1 hypothetical protein [Streptomyces lunaelactis]NUK23561.1 hypothetical protein [Streptomyces lunaelactis]NUK34029.1 hypothetical protein [Streptomyces lunaelactis]